MSQSCDQLDPFWKTRDKFERWSIWVLDFNAFSDGSIFGKILPPSSDRQRRPDHNLTDDEALELDGVMAKLVKKHPETGVFTKSYFLSGSNMVSISRYFEIDKKRMARIVDAGIAWLDAQLDQY